MLKEICSRGHEIANHGYFHRDQEYLDYSQNLEEIKVNHELVKTLLGIEMSLFAPPSGSFNKSTLEASKNLGYSTIMWTKDTIDWRDQDASLIYNRAIKNLSNGDLVLMHPTKKTVEAMTNILSTAINSGFNPTTVSKCLV